MNDTTQTTYRDLMRVGFPGQRASAVPATFISATVENAEGLDFGVAVAQGADDRGCIPFAAGETILGISVRDRSLDANTPDEFGQYDTARIMTEGEILVTVAVEVAAGDPVWVRPSNNTFQQDNSNSAVQIANALYVTSASAEGLAVVRLA